MFFAYTTTEPRVFHYRMAAVVTVEARLNRCNVFSDPRFANNAHNYLNLLIRPDDDCWQYDETGRPKKHKHLDWLWRIADRGKITEAQFSAVHSGVIERGRFSTDEVGISDNYILFSSQADESYIATSPPLVAVAEIGDHERWFDEDLKKLTVDMGRGFLRSAVSGGYSHSKLRIEKAPTDAAVWRERAIQALRSRDIAHGEAAA